MSESAESEQNKNSKSLTYVGVCEWIYTYYQYRPLHHVV